MIAPKSRLGDESVGSLTLWRQGNENGEVEQFEGHIVENRFVFGVQSQMEVIWQLALTRDDSPHCFTFT